MFLIRGPFARPPPGDLMNHSVENIGKDDLAFPRTVNIQQMSDTVNTRKGEE
jgi:hypothetical protein